MDSHRDLLSDNAGTERNSPANDLESNARSYRKATTNDSVANNASTHCGANVLANSHSFPNKLVVT